jgi:hypothetical protein
MLIRHSCSESHHETDYHEVRLLLYYLRNSHCLSADASKAWEVIRRCGSISSGDLRVAYKVARCGSKKDMLCLFANRCYKAGEPVTTYNGRLIWFEDQEEKQKSKELKTHQRGIPGTGWGMDGLPFSRVQERRMLWRRPQTAMLSLVMATGVGYMCNAPSMNCDRTPANVEVRQIHTGANIEGVLYPDVLVLFAKDDIQTGDEIICKYHQSGSVNPRFHFDCLDETHFDY